MAIEKIIKIKADTSDAVKGLNEVTDTLEDVNKEAKDTSETVDGVGKSAEKSKNGFKSMAVGIKGVGTALKAAGIGLIISVITGLTDAFSRNKRVVDALKIVFGTIQEVFSQVTDALIDTYDAVAKSTDNFDALGKVMKSLLTISLTPIKISFYGIKLALQEAQLIWEKSFFGGKDAEKIKELNLGILETKNNIQEVGEKALKAGVDVVTNFSEAVGEVRKIGSVATENLSKVSIKAAIETSKTYQKSIESAQIAEATAGKLVAKFERQAELQRQIRDDDAISITKRQEANQKLNQILSEQEKQLLLQADAVIAGAKAELLKNDSIENQVALIDALATKEQVKADIEGKRSEQIANKVALLREEKGLITSITDAENERNKIQAEFEADKKIDPLEKLQAQRDALDLENEIILEDLNKKRDLYALGTQARVDAENDYLSKKQEIDNKIIKNEEAINLQKEKNEESLKNAKIQIANQTLNILGNLAKEGSDLSKGIAASQATINTIQGITAALSTVSTVPDPFGTILKFANATAIGVAGFKNVKKILATKPVTKSAPSGLGGVGGGESSVPSAPSFNLVQGTSSNQIAESIQQQDPVQAFVVSSNITSAQELDNNIIESSSL